MEARFRNTQREALFGDRRLTNQFEQATFVAFAWTGGANLSSLGRWLLRSPLEPGM
jgi:hypothetical protein